MPLTFRQIPQVYLGPKISHGKDLSLRGASTWETVLFLLSFCIHASFLRKSVARRFGREQGRKGGINSIRKSISRTLSLFSFARSAKTNRKVELDGDDVDDDRPVGPGSVARSDGRTP